MKWESDGTEIDTQYSNYKKGDSSIVILKRKTVVCVKNRFCGNILGTRCYLVNSPTEPR